MLKKIFGIVFFVVVLVCLALPVSAKVEFIDCYILKIGINQSGFEQNLMIQISDETGEIKTYNCASRVRVNGRNYKYAEDVAGLIPNNSFAKIAVEDDVVTIINFGTEFKCYEDVKYNKKKNAFNVLNVNNSGLPVYYMYNGNIVPSHLDENHLYDISVYEYGVLITDMKSKNDESVLKLIELGSVINSDFLQNITVYCETDSNDDLILKGEIYDNKSNMLGRSQIRCNGDAEFGFNGLDNNENEYTLKLWLEDHEGNKKSSTYIKQYYTKKVEVKSGYILESAISSSAFEQNVLIKCADENGIINTYTMAERVRINGRMYKDIYDISDCIYTDVFSKMAIVDGFVTTLNFGTDCDNFYDVTYNPSDKKFETSDGIEYLLPVYYMYNDNFAPSHLDENHIYDISVYEYGILVTDMKSKNDKNVLKLIELDSLVNADFLQNITVYCESDSQDDCILKGEIYDDKLNLVANSQTRFNGDAELTFYGLENSQNEYTIKLWLEDDNSKKSSTYIKQYTTQKIEVKSEYITDVAISSSAFEENVMFKSVDQNGIINTYTCAERVRINGRLYRNNDDIINNIRSDVFLKFAIENGYITVISYNENAVSYENAQYNVSQNCFEDLSESQNSLPVYYQYDEYFAPAYLDENHLYDIKVFESGILITDIKSKNDLEVIKLIEQDCLVDSQFNQYINIYCETTVEDRCILKGEVYDENFKRIFKSETVCDGWAELNLDIYKNKFKADKIKLWLEDRYGQVISSVYTINAKVEKSKIVYGDVVMTYTFSDDDGEQMIMSVKDVNGNDKVYQCDSDVIIVSNVTVMSLGGQTADVSENQFVKMAVEDDVVKVIKLGLDTVEISGSDFVYEDGSLYGNVCVINNSQQSADLICYTAIFDKDGVLKDISIDKAFAQSGENVYIYPQFDKYNNYSQGDYIKVFAWDSKNISPIVSGIITDIIAE